MPSINRIRVNNVKYNFGTQMYDDFTMRLYGQNTLYDLANGGGKSVLMLLLMQCMIPNCTLDEKQPLEKLFRENCGNTTIHSLIEWKLDNPDIKDGMRYMTTGFCARKARDRGEEENREVASVEYFNYCIFYQEYNKYDIMNIPLSEGDERLTYQALKNYLHDLSRRENRVEVFVFDRKGEYQRFLSRYGIIESQWEIIRGINKTEGHVRTYFETNYRTTRKVVEDLLIEEIIEKAYLVKTEQEEKQESSAAKLLMSIREQLRVLAEKKRDIANYDHEAELIALLRDRIDSFSGLYSERDELFQGIGDIYLTLDASRARKEQEEMRLQKKVEDAEEAYTAARAEAEVLKTSKKERKLEALQQKEQIERDEIGQAVQRLTEKEEQLNRRKAELDYLDYLEEKKKLERLVAEASLEAPMDLAPVIAGIRKYLFDDMGKLEKQKTSTEGKLQSVERKKEELRKLLEDARISLAVNRKEQSEIEAASEQDEKRINQLRQTGMSDLLLPAGIEIAECMKLLEMERKNIEELRENVRKKEEEDFLLREVVRRKEDEINILNEQKKKRDEEKEKRQKTAKKLEEIKKIYHAEREELKAAIYGKLSRDSVRCMELEREKLKIEKRCQEIRNGRLIEISADVEEVLSYISTRHGITALFGADYIAALEPEDRERLLLANPELPYGIITRDYEKLAGDRKLTSMEVGSSVVRIYDMEKLDHPAETGDHWFAVRHSRAFFLENEGRDRLLQSLEAAVSNIKTEHGYLSDALETEKKDLEFLLAAEAEAKNVEEEADPEILTRELEEQRRKLEAASAEADDSREKLAKSEEEIRQLEQKLEVLQEMDLLQQRFADRNLTAAELRKSERTLLEGIRQKEEEEEERNREAVSLRTALQQICAEKDRIELNWNESYAAYDTGCLTPEEGTLEELIGKYRLWMQKQAGIREQLEQQQLLRSTMEAGTSRLLRNIRERRVSLEELEEAEKAGELLPGDPAELSEQADRLRKEREDLELRRSAAAGLSAEAQRLAGSIEYAIENIRMAYGSYETAPYTEEELEQRIPLVEEAKERTGEELKKAREEQKHYQKQTRESEGLYREAARLTERYRIDLSRYTVQSISEDELQRAFEDLLLRMDRNEKSLERARSQMLRTKGQVTQTLMDLGAATLSVSVRDDADIPGSKEAAEALSRRLSEMEELIRLERSRVEQGLTDMEKLKENFVEQCVERCLDVRTELDKLPKLSVIHMKNSLIPGQGQDGKDGPEGAGGENGQGGKEEPVQMLRLSIPYVKDEFLRQRMSDYIDRIIAEADTKKTEAEQHKYLQSELALKRLFGVIVTDMNKIRLQLYKRERIREQSRYLKYEEAVGSTGQSQGIYIQFLISIINYISGMYSMQDSALRSKTIFIDNPFGAAKDIYIWEPIFELLHTNHVQLIVPSRGATPEITGRFDVNYILGQQMTGNRALTVVTNYSSRTSEEAVEYHQLQYEQETFDFV